MNMYYYNMVEIIKKVKFEKLLIYKIVVNDCVYILMFKMFIWIVFFFYEVENLE